MSTITRHAIRVALFIFLFLLAAFAYLNFAVTAFHHNRIEAALSDASGLQVTAGQPFDLSVGEYIVFSANDVAVTHQDWVDTDPLIELDKLTLSIDTLALISGRLVINWINGHGVRVHLQQASDRDPNWTVSSAEESEESTFLSLPIALKGFSIQMSEDESVAWFFESDTLSSVNVLIADTGTDVDVRLAGTSLAIYSSEDESSESEGPLFDDSPLDLAALEGFGLTADIKLDNVSIDEKPVGALSTSVTISEGGVRVENFALVGEDAALSGSAFVQPVNDTYETGVAVDLENWRSDFLAIDGEAISDIPLFNGELELNGTGTSLQAIMAGANGRFSGRHSSGAVDLQAAGPLFSDVASTLIQTLNPLAESSTQTTLDCGVYEVDITNGLATVEQFSVQTDKLTVISSGEVSLGTETIDMALRTKSREGLGSVATSFFKLGGTLREPSMEVDAGGTVTTAGAAVATGGLSVFAKGLWDRLSAEADLCDMPDS